ncbi:tripartite tricarboxylate transporter substrate binding protein [Pusillimonas sp. SM2304]|uniref:tripartite tricarboxylate transporter substrate binding protein n=1 Tax=Pusillimonas sp. SM2304 TaxID=3073241 RepID=UPI0028769CCD|nr:tripartite tricarboxylate transporter substrate binding protein [Pusillimonas sp. SM2304]MDS1138995.1 tripartite tricarboxylate transporter substrate binding protein [Pusillimonas sp. SM2304]
MSSLKTMQNVLLILAAMFCTNTYSANYPERPLRLIVAFPAGGTSDTIARLLADRMSQKLGQPVTVENRTGANGIVGTQDARTANPDGYTIILVPSGHAINSTLNPAATYDPIKDFTMISLIGTVPMVVTAGSNLGAKNIAGLIETAKASEKKISYGSGGVGSSNQLATELFGAMAGISTLNHIPYRGDTPGIADLLGGHISFIFLNVPSALPLVKEGKLTALAITGAERSPLLPDVPTISETVPGYAAGSWHIIIGPAGIPEDRVAILSKTIVDIVHEPDFSDRLLGMGIDPVGSTPEELKTFMSQEIEKWKKVIEDADIKL